MIKTSRRHLEGAGESWGQHRRFAWWYARNCIQAGLAAFVHGLVPALFQTSASRRVKMLADPDALRQTGGER